MLNRSDYKSALVVAAHPDDEVLGVGGTMALLAEQGFAVYVVYMTGGKGGRVDANTTQSAETMAEQKELAEELKKSCEILGVKDFWLWDFPDNRMDTVSRMDVSLKLNEISRKTKPELVFCHHYGDYNWDHQVVYDATLMSFRANHGDHFPKALFSYEVGSSSERAHQGPRDIFCPNFYVDIKTTMPQKKKAIEAYASEGRPYPHPRSSEGVEYMARRRGMEAGMEVAEAFSLIRGIYV